MCTSTIHLLELFELRRSTNSASFFPLNLCNLGFKVSTKGCCGTGNIEVSYLCNRLDHPDTCDDDTKYVFWDSFHPSEAAYRALTDQLFSKYIRELF